ncbi:MAG: DUF4783 domain-containing protein [Bacteroidales bacterium]|nr:DUF4783 domain-containing protein [Bacteroidales bacterium]
MQLRFKSFIAASCFLLATFGAKAQSGNYDVFVPISKYLAQGNAEALSAWFSDNLDITVLQKGGNSSKVQAKQIVNGFFNSHTPRSFEVTYTAGRANMKYAVGNLNAGGETYLVTIFVYCTEEKNQIQQFKIERVQ